MSEGNLLPEPKLSLDDYLNSFDKQINLQPRNPNLNCFSIGDDEAEVQEVVSCHLQPESQVPGVKLLPQQTLSKKSSVQSNPTAQVLTQALTQRKTENFKQINHYMRRHMQYCIPHMNILLQVQVQLSSKISVAQVTAKSVIEYLNELKLCYRSWIQHISSRLQRQPKLSPGLGYNKVREGLKALFTLPASMIQSTEAFCNWLENECVMEIAQSVEMYDKALEGYSQQISALKIQADKHLRLMYRQYQLVEHLMLKGTKKGHDILFEQLYFIQYVHEANKSLVEWGRMLNFFLKAVEKNEVVLHRALKKYVVLCLEKLQKLAFINEKHLLTIQNWQQINPQQDIPPTYAIKQLLPKEAQEFILSHSPNKPQQTSIFQHFSQMESQYQSIGTLSNLIQKLALKRFHCQLDLGEKSESNDMDILSTLDGYIVFIQQSNQKPYTKMLISDILLQRANDVNVVVSEKRVGIIKNVWNRQALTFKNRDEADQFVAFIAKSPEERDTILI